MRSRTKIFRLTELQLKQLEQYIQKENTNFTDFIHSLIEREVMQDAASVQQHPEEIKPVRTKVKTVVEVVKRYQKTDPALLLELAKIGNNINQIARAANRNQFYQDQQVQANLQAAETSARAATDAVDKLAKEVTKLWEQLV